MDDNPKRDIGFEDLLRFHDQVLSLNRAGVPFDLGIDDSRLSLSAQLNQIASHLALQVGLGQSIEHVLTSDPKIPDRYRLGVETWFHAGGTADAFEALHSAAGEDRRWVRDVRGASLHPILLLGLVYFGYAYLVEVATPAMLGFYEQMDQPVPWSLAFLQGARTWLPWWGIGLPILFVLGLLLLRSRWLDRLSKSRGSRSQVQHYLARANQAQGVAQLIDHDHVPANALLRVFGEVGGTVPGHSVQPLMRWATGMSTDPKQVSAALNVSAQIYRSMAQERIDKQRTWLPILLGSLLGGAIVLLFGLSLFLPITSLLVTLTRP